MGSWGPGLYGSDDAQEIRDKIKLLLRLPKSGDELLTLLKSLYPSDGPKDDMYTVLHVVAADQFHKYGVESPRLFNLAKRIILDGHDDRAMARLGMSATLRSKRRRLLTELQSKWELAPEKPSKRKLRARPERHLAQPGEIFAYPTRDGNPANTHDPAAYIRERFKPDGWAAFVVGRNEHRFGHFSTSYVMRLHLDGPHVPTEAACRSAPISGCVLRSWGLSDPRPAVGWTVLTTSVLKKLGARSIGDVGISWRRICERMPLVDFDPRSEPSAIHDILHVTNRTLADTVGGIDHAAPLDVHLAHLISNE